MSGEQTTVRKDRVARQEYQGHQQPDPEKEALQVRRDQLSHPCDWMTFRDLVRPEGAAVEPLARDHARVGIGAGIGFEPAMLRWTGIQHTVLTDTGLCMVAPSMQTFSRILVPLPGWRLRHCDGRWSVT